MKGILTIAIGSHFYGHLAEALAKSVRKHSTIPISVIADEDGLTGIANPKLFDQIIEPKFVHYLDNYVFNPFKLKTYIYDYSPYEETLYIDADNIFIKPLDTLFDTLEGSDFQIHEVKRWTKENWDRCAMVWAKNVGVSIQDIIDIYECGDDATYPEYNSSFVWFKKNPKNAEYFGYVKGYYLDRRTKYKAVGKCYPDELAWNITSAKMNHFGKISGFKPIYHTWESSKKERVPPVAEIMKDYWLLGMAGGYHTPQLVRVYEKLSGAKFDRRKKIFHRK